MDSIYSVKMRASQKADNGINKHISGAERIIRHEHLSKCIESLTQRAIMHSKGSADDINIKIEKIDENEIRIVDVLRTFTTEVDTKDEGLAYIENFLKAKNIKHANKIVSLLQSKFDMSGAMLIDINTLERLDNKGDKGIRVTYMDYKDTKEIDLKPEKNHYREALALSSKVLSCPNVWGELCISDDPNYITGYIATKSDGYNRVTKLKDYGSSNGARIILFDGDKADVDCCIEYLTKAKVWINEDII